MVGDGTPASCTGDAFVDAVAQGGVITFDCGPAPVVIKLRRTAKIFNDTGPRIVIDGGGTDADPYSLALPAGATLVLDIDARVAECRLLKGEADAAIVIFRPPIVLKDSPVTVATRIVEGAATSPDKPVFVCTLSETATPVLMKTPRPMASKKRIGRLIFSSTQRAAK